MRRIKHPILLFLQFLFLVNMLSAQDAYTLDLKSGKTIPTENFDQFINQADIAPAEIFQGKYYRIIQFYDIPTTPQQEKIQLLGIELLDYYPQRAYLAAIPAGLPMTSLATLDIRAVLEPSQTIKMDETLLSETLEPWAKHKNDIRVMLKYHKHLLAKTVRDLLTTEGLPIVKSNGINNYLETAIPRDQLERMASQPWVAHLGMVPAPSIKDDVEGRSLHRSNALDTGLPLGRNFDGSGVGVLVRDDGQIGPHIDFTGRLNQELADVGGEFDTHGDNVAGIMAGAGNFDPTKRGMAAGSEVHVLDYDETFLDETLSLFTNENVIVTNSSYSNGCNDGYTEITATVDQQLFDHPTLMHVFSAGNSNSNDCGFGAGDQWGNITGGHKQGKNTITVANIFDNADLVNSSSRGPAHDGRIKPDIAANGQDQFGTEPDNTYAEFGGTSGAAPGVAGVFAQLQQAHRDLNGGTTGDAALIKACLLNTANDLGNKGPDFKFGWGHINAYRAVKTLEENRYILGTLEQGATDVLELTIPENTVSARVMLYWSDPEATIGTNMALVNNLDLTLTNGSDTFFPWVLDPTPNTTTLDAPATRGVDNLNNMEQVALDNPEPGVYQVNIAGTTIPFAAKTYYLVYEFRTAAVELTYPIGGENFTPFEAQRIHWDAAPGTEDFIISYSTNDGGTWSILTTVNSEVTYYEWVIPNIVTGQGKVRVQRGSSEVWNTENFNISSIPTNLDLLEACPDGITLTWDEMPDAESYDIFVLGDKYMEVIGNVLTNQYTYFTNQLSNEQYFSVRANLVGGAQSRRTNAFYFSGGLQACIVPNNVGDIDLAVHLNTTQNTCEEIFEETQEITFTNMGANTLTAATVGFQVDNNPAFSEELTIDLMPGAAFTHEFTQSIIVTEEGAHTLKTWVSIPENDYAEDDTITNNFVLNIIDAGAPLAYQQPFSEAVFPPTDYSLINPDNGITWEYIDAVQSDGEEGQMIWVNNFDYDSAQEENVPDDLLTTVIDLSTATNEVLSFDIAYREYNFGGFQIPDGLQVFISTDCGNTFNDMIFEKFGDDLSSLASSNARFFPASAGQWKKEYVDISAYYGQNVMLKFVNQSGYGNNIFLDNINVEEVQFAPPAAIFITSRTEVCETLNVTFFSQSEGEELEYLWEFGPGSNPSTFTASGPLQVQFNEPGLNNVSLTVTNLGGSSTQNTDIMVFATPVAGFNLTKDSSSITIQLENTSQNATEFMWDFGDGNFSNEENPTHVYANNDIYEVKLTVTNNGCTDVEITQTVEFLPVGTIEFDRNFAVIIQPNPSQGYFRMAVSSDESAVLGWSLINLQGQILDQGILQTNQPQLMEQHDLVAGVYLIRLTAEQGTHTERMVIMK